MTGGKQLCSCFFLTLVGLSSCTASLQEGQPLDEGWGVISGSCGVLDGREWQADEPFFFQNAIDFGDAGFDAHLLTPGGNDILEAGNLGGSSLHSEIIAFELLARCEGAELLKTETEIAYLDEGGKKTDLLVDMDGHLVSVSVTRAFHYPPSEPCQAGEIHDLLQDKLIDVQLSQANADEENAWSRSILAVIAWDADCARQVQTAFGAIEPDTLADTIVWTTVTDGDDQFAY